MESFRRLANKFGRNVEIIGNAWRNVAFLADRQNELPELVGEEPPPGAAADSQRME